MGESSHLVERCLGMARRKQSSQAAARVDLSCSTRDCAHVAHRQPRHESSVPVVVACVRIATHATWQGARGVAEMHRWHGRQTVRGESRWGQRCVSDQGVVTRWDSSAHRGNGAAAVVGDCVRRAWHMWRRGSVGCGSDWRHERVAVSTVESRTLRREQPPPSRRRRRGVRPPRPAAPARPAAPPWTQWPVATAWCERRRWSYAAHTQTQSRRRQSPRQGGKWLAEVIRAHGTPQAWSAASSLRACLPASSGAGSGRCSRQCAMPAAAGATTSAASGGGGGTRLVGAIEPLVCCLQCRTQHIQRGKAIHAQSSHLRRRVCKASRACIERVSKR